MPGDRLKCPAAHVLNIVGDHWALLVIRDIGIRGKTSFSEISASPEHIVPSALTSRVEVLLYENLITKTPVPGGPGRQYCYELAECGGACCRSSLWCFSGVPDTIRVHLYRPNCANAWKLILAVSLNRGVRIRERDS